MSKGMTAHQHFGRPNGAASSAEASGSVHRREIFSFRKPKARRNAGDEGESMQYRSTAGVVARAVQQAHWDQSAFVSRKGKERATDEDWLSSDDLDMDAHLDWPVARQVASPLEQATSKSSHRATARVGGVVSSSAAPAASSAASQHSGSSEAVQSTPAAGTTTRLDSSSASYTSSAASQTSNSPASVAASSTTAAPSSSSLISLATSAASVTSIAQMLTSSADPSSSSIASSASAAQESATHTSSPSVSKSTPLMIVIILGSIVGAATVLFGLAWLCKRSSLGPNRRSRNRVLAGHWSPGAGSTDDFSFVDAEKSEQLGTRNGRSAMLYRPSPMPSLQPDRPDNQGYHYGNSFSLNVAAPHQIQTPVFSSQPMAQTASNGRGWALFDQPGPSDQARLQTQPVVDEVAGPSVLPPRRPTFIQKAIDQPARGATVDVPARLSHGERSATVSEPKEPKSTNTSRSNTTSATNGLLSALALPMLLSSSSHGGREKYMGWPGKSFRRKSTRIPDDSDFEGTIGAPDRDVPRARRIKNGPRFSCDGTSSSSAGEDSAAEDMPVASPLQQSRRGGMGLLYFESGMTPKTPGVAGVGSTWARRSAQFDRFGPNRLDAQPPVAVVSANVPGRQLLGAPGMPPQFAQRASNGLLQPGLPRKMAPHRQTDGASQEAALTLNDRIASWWTGSWDAEWPSPTSSAIRQMNDPPLSPRSSQPAAEHDEIEILVLSPTTIEGPQALGTPAFGDTSILRAQDSLKRMSSLRPKFAATTSLQSWLHPDGPSMWLASGGSAPEANGAESKYEGSLKSPMIIDEAGELSDFVIGEDDGEEFPLRHKRSDYSLAEESQRQAFDVTDRPESEASLPSYRTHAASPTLPESEDGLAEVLLEEPIMPETSLDGSLWQRSSARRASMLPNSVSLPSMPTEQDIQDTLHLQCETDTYVAEHRAVEHRSKEARRKQRKAERKRDEAMISELTYSPPDYVDSDGYEVRHVAVNMAPQPAQANVVRKQSLEGETSDVSEYSDDQQTALSEYDVHNGLGAMSPSPQVFRAPVFAQYESYGYDDVIAKEPTPKAKSSKQRVASAGCKRLPSAVTESDRILLAQAKRLASAPHHQQQQTLQHKSRRGDADGLQKRRSHLSSVRQQQQRRIASTGSRPRPQPLQQSGDDDDSPSSSSDSDISVRRWGRGESFSLSSSSESTNSSSTASAGATKGAIADWHAAKRRRGVPAGVLREAPGRGRVVSAGVCLRH